MLLDNVCPACKNLLSMVPQNMGMTDRLIRGVLGIAILIIGVMKRSWWGLLGIYLIITALLGFCPIYMPFNISTKEEIPEDEPVVFESEAVGK